MTNMNTVESGSVELYGEISFLVLLNVRQVNPSSILMMNMNRVESGGVDGEISRPLWGN